MSITRRKFIVTTVGGLTLPLTHALAWPILPESSHGSELGPKYTTLSEIYNSLDGLPDVDRFRTHGGFASQYYRRRYQEAFGHGPNKTWRRCRMVYTNFTQMLELAVKQNTPILELKLDSFRLPEQMS